MGLGSFLPGKRLLSYGYERDEFVQHGVNPERGEFQLCKSFSESWVCQPRSSDSAVSQTMVPNAGGGLGPLAETGDAGD